MGRLRRSYGYEAPTITTGHLANIKVLLFFIQHHCQLIFTEEKKELKKLENACEISNYLRSDPNA